MLTAPKALPSAAHAHPRWPTLAATTRFVMDSSSCSPPDTALPENRKLTPISDCTGPGAPKTASRHRKTFPLYFRVAEYLPNPCALSQSLANRPPHVSHLHNCKFAAEDWNEIA